MEGGVGELKPYLQSITGAGLDVRAGQQHVERIYDLVFISLFNTISVAFKGTQREGDRKWREWKRERQSHLCVCKTCSLMQSCVLYL